MKLWTDDGRTPEHGYTISSPCEPKGSGELKISDVTNGTFLKRHTLKTCGHMKIFHLFFRNITCLLPLCMYY